jgi:hypothetical protein
VVNKKSHQAAFGRFFIGRTEKMKILGIVLITIISTLAQAQTVDLRAYFPDNVVNTYNRADGSASTRYTLQRSLPGAPTGIDSIYYSYLSLPGKTGTPYMWRKEYSQSGSWCTATYGTLFMGGDLSVTEVGDWRSSTGCTPNVLLGYKNHGTSVNTGLVWSPPGGLSANPLIAENDVWGQATNGSAYANSGSQSYSKTGLIEVLPTFTPAYGRSVDGTWGAGLSKTYTDVIHIVMYHGTKVTPSSPVRCVGPISANGSYYQSYKDYSSYAIELWLAAGVGIIQENTPFIEDASYWALPNCTGDIFSGAPGSWKTYIDQI